MELKSLTYTSLARLDLDVRDLEDIHRTAREMNALEAEDHYLRVHTALGSELVLARFSDAVAQLAGHSGLQVHRGWWVADDAVTGVEGSAGRTVVRLRNGLVAPVSRTYLQAVRSRGWPKA